MELEKTRRTEMEEQTERARAERFAQQSGETASDTSASYLARTEQALESRAYCQWAGPEQQGDRRSIADHDQKKRTADLASLRTRKTLLERYPDCYDEQNIRRMSSELDSDKLKIYSVDDFSDLVSAPGPDCHIEAFREAPSGRIYVRDTEDVRTLQHAAVHETVHDQSYQSAEKLDGQTWQIRSGVERATVLMRPDGTVAEMRIVNTAVNEGITEMYTVDALEEQGGDPGFSGYTAELGWARALREKIGEQTVADAYFGGHEDALAQRFDSLSGAPGAWERFGAAMDRYQQVREDARLRQEDPGLLRRCYDAVWDILEDVQTDGADKVRKLVKRL